MQTVVFRQSGTLRDGSLRIPVRANEVYAACDGFCRSNAALMAPVQVHAAQLPAVWDAEALSSLAAQPGQELRVLIVNGFGTGYGDLILGSTALERLHQEIRKRGKTPEIDFLIREGRASTYREVFKRNPYVRRIHSGVLPLHELRHYDWVFSNEHILFDADFPSSHMGDFFMRRLGLSIEDPPIPKLYPDPKRLKSTLKEVRRIRDSHRGERFAVLNFFASTLRAIPEFVWKDWIEAFAVDYRVVLIGAQGNERRVQQFISGLDSGLRNRVHDLSAVTARSFDALIGILDDLADLVITPDTSVMHVAGALRKSCVGVFFSIDPALRIRDYPSVQAFCPEAFRNSRFWGKSHLSSAENKVLALDPEYVALWRAIDPESVKRRFRLI